MTTRELLEIVDDGFIIDLMEELGSPCYGTGESSSGGKYLIFRTICHGGNKPKLYWYSDTKTFYCYTQCGSMSLFDLISRVLNLSFAQSFRYVARRLGIIIASDREGFQDPEDIKNLNKYVHYLEQREERRSETPPPREITKFYDINDLKRFDNNAFYQGWIDEGITIESMRKYLISFFWMQDHIIIPHLNADGRLVGIRRRSLDPNDVNAKYMPEYFNGRLYEHPLALNLYGLYYNQETIKRKKEAIIVEGEKSVLLADGYYPGNSTMVAICGFNVSEWHIQTLFKLGVRTVYLGFDKDFDKTYEHVYMQDTIAWENYQAYLKRINNNINKLRAKFNVRLIEDRQGLLQPKDSPIDRGKDNFETLLKQAKLVKD